MPSIFFPQLLKDLLLGKRGNSAPFSRGHLCSKLCKCAPLCKTGGYIHNSSLLLYKCLTLLTFGVYWVDIPLWGSMAKTGWYLQFLAFSLAPALYLCRAFFFLTQPVLWFLVGTGKQARLPGAVLTSHHVYPVLDTSPYVAEISMQVSMLTRWPLLILYKTYFIQTQ